MQKRVAPSSLACVALLAHFVDAHGAASAGTPVLKWALCGAVAAVLRAAAGLDAQQGAALDVGDVVMAAMDLGGAEDQLRQRQAIDALELGKGFHGQRQ